MSGIADKRLYRIIDANFNRAKEGLRVCEDIFRYLYDQKGITQRYKAVRHALTTIVLRLPVERIIQARDAAGDVGQTSSPVEFRRDEVQDIFYANSQRIKESMRVLEEFAKLLDGRTAEDLKRLRYKIYTLEKESNNSILKLKNKK